MNIPVGAQVFDLVFHPTSSIVYTALLTGEVKAFRYNDQGQHQSLFSLKPSHRSCRALTISENGQQLWAVGKSKGLCAIDTTIGQLTETRTEAHEAPINRIKQLTPWMLSTGDDNGTIKLWDPRSAGSIRSYSHHFDYITDFLWLDDNKQLVATSGDGTLSVIDVRSKKTEPLAHSEDQEDELLSILAIKGGAKFVVGTQLGILSIFNKISGWGDCVDRVRGHPHSVDALCAVPSLYPLASSTILTGSSDGLLRAVQLFPTKLVGIVTDHGAFPIERIAVDQRGEGKWVGSAGHEEALRLTDLSRIFGSEDHRKDSESEDQVLEDGTKDEAEGSQTTDTTATRLEGGRQTKQANADDDSDVSGGGFKEKKKKRKREKDSLTGKKKKGRNELIADAGFFSEL